MKKFIAILVILTMLVPMGACGAKEEPASTPAPTQAPAPTPVPTPTPTPAPTEPPYELGIARARFGEVLYTTLDLYTNVVVKGQFADYYVIEGEEVDLIIDKRVIRLDREDPFEPWDGYAQSGAKVYETAYMDGEVIAELSTNTEVKVLDGKDDWLRIEWAEGSGYAHIDDISDTLLVARRGGGGGGGGAKDGTDVSMGDLALVLEKKPVIMPLAAYFGQEIEPIANAPAVTLTHETRAYLFLTERGDELKVTKVDEENCEIYIDGFYATAPRWLVRVEGDEEYEPWTAFAEGGKMFGEYQMRNELLDLKTNEQVLVIDELPTCYVVEFDGQIGYVPIDELSETQYVAYRGGGGGGGGGGDWTPPAL